jgi:FeS assembly SUF system regulator
MRMSSLADYAVVLMSAAARHCGGMRCNARALATETGLPLPTAQKLVSKLSAAGLIESVRGAGGGFRLSRPPAAITLADIVEAVDGPIEITVCAGDHASDCAMEGSCHVRPHWQIVNRTIRAALSSVTLASLGQHVPTSLGHDPARPEHRLDFKRTVS